MKQPSLWQTRDTLPALPHSAALAILLLTAALAGIFSGSASSVLVTMLTAAVYAVLLLMYRTPLVLLALPGAYLIALFFIRDPLGALPALAFAPLGAVIAACIYRRRKCFRTVLWLTAVSLLVFVGVTVGMLCTQYDSLADGVRAVLAEMDKYLAESWQLLVKQLGTEKAAELEEAWKSLAASYPYFLPGFAALTAMVLSWASCKLTRRILIWLHADKSFFRKKWTIMVPVPWAYAFVAVTLATIVVSLLSFTVDGADWLVCVIADLLMVLEPPLVAIGARRLRLTLRRLRRRGLTAPYIFLVVFLVAAGCCAGLELIPFLFAYLGTLYVTRRAKIKRLQKAEAAAAGTAPDAQSGKDAPDARDAADAGDEDETDIEAGETAENDTPTEDGNDADTDNDADNDIEHDTDNGNNNDTPEQ